jgi:hypothetical protein
VIECSVDLLNESLRLGALRGGKIVLRTIVLPVSGNSPVVLAEPDEGETSEEDGEEAMVNEGNMKEYIFAKLGYTNHYKFFVDHFGNKNPRVEALYSLGLILEPIDGGVFRRVETFQPLDEGGTKQDALPWEGAEERAITIV